LKEKCKGEGDIVKSDWIDRLKQAEQVYQVETIECNGIKIWPFIRWAIFDTYFRSEDLILKESKSKNNDFLKIKRGLRAIRTTSLNILLKKNASILFTDDSPSALRCMDGELVDIIAVPVFASIRKKDLVPIVTKVRTMTAVTVFSQYVNTEFFSILVKLYSYIKSKDVKSVVNRQILDQIVSDLQIEFDIDRYLLTVCSFVSVFRIYFGLIKPKKIFLNCYYGMDRMAASYVGKEMDIPVIELQHGVITSRHLAYFTSVNIEPNPYPSYLFCFGERFKKFVSPFICDAKNVFVTGNYYIDYIKRNEAKNRALFIKKYSNISSKKIVTVAGQDIFDNYVLEFIEKISEFHCDIYFIYIPRIMSPELVHYSHKDISIETELDVYQCMQNSHITSTVYSTCAIESLAFGTPVILINIQNLAKSIYADFFSPSDAVFYADTPEEYVSCITAAVNRDREQIASDAVYYYAENLQKCTKEAFEKITKYSKNSK
jgi:hypothetical protein